MREEAPVLTDQVAVEMWFAYLWHYLKKNCMDSIYIKANGVWSVPLSDDCVWGQGNNFAPIQIDILQSL